MKKRINNIDQSLQDMSSALSNMTSNLEKHSDNFEQMGNTIENISHDLHQKTTNLEDGIAKILKTLGIMAKKRSYSDINGNIRAFDINEENKGSDMETDSDISQSSSHNSSTARNRVRVFSQSSVQTGNNTDQSQADGAL